MKFCKGSIVRIYLKNFVTFDEIELTPKNKLNLVVGANGSGKSTFVCAIVLGLGGKPNIIGRSPNVSDYVKHGREKAEIDLELFNPDGTNYIISRHIQSNSTSSWFLQHKSVPFKKVESLIAELNIQINNLCQVLPQDRVQDFAKMDQKELLDNTQKSIGDNQMCEWFNKLKTCRTSIMEREKILTEKVKKYETEVQKNKRMEVDVKSYKEKQDILNKISIIKKKLKWLEYEEKNEARKKAEDEYKSAQSNYNKLKNDLEPLLKRIQDAEKEQIAIHNKIKAESDNNNLLNNKLKDFIRQHLRNKDNITRIKQELKSKLEAESQKEAQIAEIERHIKEMEDLLPKMNETALVSGIKEADAEIDKILKKVAQARSCENEVREKASQINQSVRASEHKLEQLDSVTQKKLQLLSNFEDVCKAYEWLQVNRDKFQKQIYGPIFMEVNVANPQHARYMEHIVSWKDLVAFVCEDPKDMSNLLRTVRDGMKLKINAITSSPPERSIEEEFPPKIPISQLRQFGFESYLINSIEGPPAILKYFCKLNGFHLIPFGSNKIDNSLDSIPMDLRSFFSESTFYRITYSKYSGEKIQSVTNVGGSRFLSFSVNRDLVQKCNEELDRKRKEFQDIEKQLSEMNELKKGYDVEINSLRNQKREFSRKLEHLKASNVRLRLKRDELVQILQKRIDPVAEEAKAQHEIEACLKEMVKCEHGVLATLRKYLESCAAVALVKIEREQIGALIRKRESDSKELESQAKAALDEAEKLKSECIKVRSELKALHSKAKELTDGLDANDERFKQKYLPLFRDLPGNRVNLESTLHETDAMAKCLQGCNDERVLKEYEESCKLIKSLEKELDQLKLSASGIQGEAVDILQLWLPKIEDLVDSINERFGAFFAAMSCAGVVQLDKGLDPSAYENYGLTIKVKFRNEGELQALDSHTQSGGERALTTAVYLLSLQAITTVPFRCVDEINQGMDEINEKRVYHLIMNSISTCDTAQYFLVTPTLFRDVVYPQGTAVHCVHCTTEEGLSNEIHWSKERYFKNLGIAVNS